jgi:[ribosomal protein S5]-alanine N-acetyltransferase
VTNVSARGAASRKARIPTFPELDTDRLHLRALTDDDGGWYLEQFSRPETVDGTGYPSPDGIAGAIDDIRQYGTLPFDEGRGIRWAICLRKADGSPEPRPIGTCSLLDWEDEPISRAELGYTLMPGQWGNGYASEAIAAIQQFGFDVMGLERIEALVWDRNERSSRVLEHLGYRPEALLRESFLDSTGTLRNEWRYVLERGKEPLRRTVPDLPAP